MVKRQAFWKKLYRPDGEVTKTVLTSDVDRARGRAAKVSGSTLEASLLKSHVLYQRRGLSCIGKLNPETAGAPGAMRFKAHSDVDYMGWWRTAPDKWARPIAFDAKSHKGASFTLPTIEKNRRTMLNQIAFLLDFGAPENADAFLLVVDRTLGCGWLLFRAALEQLKAEKSVLLREKLDAGLTHHQPHFALATIREMAQGEPEVPYLRVLSRLRASSAA